MESVIGITLESVIGITGMRTRTTHAGYCMAQFMKQILDWPFHLTRNYRFGTKVANGSWWAPRLPWDGNPYELRGQPLRLQAVNF